MSQTEPIVPSGFIFLFEKRQFLTIQGRNVSIWNFRGEQVTRFQDHLLMAEAGNSTNIFVSRKQDFILSYCSHWTPNGER